MLGMDHARDRVWARPRAHPKDLTFVPSIPALTQQRKSLSQVRPRDPVLLAHTPPRTWRGRRRSWEVAVMPASCAELLVFSSWPLALKSPKLSRFCCTPNSFSAC